MSTHTNDRHRHSPIDPLRPEQVARLIEILRRTAQHRTYCLVAVMASTGLSAAEVCALRFRDLDNIS